MLITSHPLKGSQEFLKRILIIAPIPLKYSHRLARVWYGQLFWPFLLLIFAVIIHFFLPQKREKLYGDCKIKMLSHLSILELIIGVEN